jgi:hypothetical protein
MGAHGPALAVAEAGRGPGATPERLVLNSQPLEPSSPRRLPPPPAGARLGTGVPQAAAGPGHGPGQRLGWHPAAALLPRWARGPTPQKGLHFSFYEAALSEAAAATAITHEDLLELFS